jgi:hypothetical protein
VRQGYRIRDYACESAMLNQKAIHSENIGRCIGDKFREKIPDVVTMPRYFHKQGYYTVSMGKISHNHMPDKISFDEPDLRPAEYMTREMIDRDAESFYYDDALKAELAEVRKQRLARKRYQPTGHIKLGVKSIGKPSAVTPHAGFDVAGGGNVAWSRCCDTRRLKGELTGNTKVDLH